MGSPLWRAAIIVLNPPWLMTIEQRGKSSVWGIYRSALTFAGSRPRSCGSRLRPVVTISVTASPANAATIFSSSWEVRLKTVPRDAYTTGWSGRPVNPIGKRLVPTGVKHVRPYLAAYVQRNRLGQGEARRDAVEQQLAVEALEMRVRPEPYVFTDGIEQVGHQHTDGRERRRIADQLRRHRDACQLPDETACVLRVLAHDRIRAPDLTVIEQGRNSSHRSKLDEELVLAAVVQGSQS